MSVTPRKLVLAAALTTAVALPFSPAMAAGEKIDPVLITAQRLQEASHYAELSQ